MDLTVPVLKPDILSYILIESIIDILPRKLLEKSSGEIEIPVIVEEIGPWLLRSTLRLVGVVPGIGSRMLAARTGGDQIEDSRLFLNRKKAADIIHPQFFQGF